MDRNFAQVEDVKAKVRDLGSHAILSTDLQSLNAYKAGREKRKKDAAALTTLQEEMKDIKEMLHLLLNRESK